MRLCARARGSVGRMFDPFLRQNATLNLEFTFKFRIRHRILRVSFKSDFGRRYANF